MKKVADLPNKRLTFTKRLKYVISAFYREVVKNNFEDYTRITGLNRVLILPTLDVVPRKVVCFEIRLMIVYVPSLWLETGVRLDAYYISRRHADGIYHPANQSRPDRFTRNSRIEIETRLLTGASVNFGGLVDWVESSANQEDIYNRPPEGDTSDPTETTDSNSGQPSTLKIMDTSIRALPRLRTVTTDNYALADLTDRPPSTMMINVSRISHIFDNTKFMSKSEVIMMHQRTYRDFNKLHMGLNSKSELRHATCTICGAASFYLRFKNIAANKRQDCHFVCNDCLTKIATCRLTQKNMFVREMQAFQGILVDKNVDPSTLQVCNTCGHITVKEEVILYGHHSDGEVFMCKNCSHAVPYNLQRYTFKPVWTKHNTGDRDLKNDDVYFGLEIEVEPIRDRFSTDFCVRKTIETLGWERACCKRDSSIAENGFEIVAHPMTLQYLKKSDFLNNLQSCSDFIQGFGAYNAGIHVHVCREAFYNGFHLAKFMTFFSKNHKFIEVTAQRFPNPSGWVHETLSKVVDKYSFRQQDRHEAINVANPTTIEVRIFRSNLRKERILKNVEFTHSLIRYALIFGMMDMDAMKYWAWLSERNKEYKNLYEYLQPVMVSPTGMELLDL